MFDIHTEGAMFNYFIVNAISGGNIDRAKVFLAFGDIFLKSTEESKRLYAIVKSESVEEVSTVAEYNRYKRIEQYCGLCGIDEGIPADEKAATDIKGSALVAATCSRLILNDVTTVNGSVQSLMNQAETGKIIALRILGFLQCEGLLVKKNLSAGVKNLMKAAKWGDVPSALALMKYSEKSRAEAGEILAAAVKNTSYENILAAIELRYGIKCDRPFEETDLIKKAFAQKKLNPDNYDYMCARLVFSEILSFKDKEKIIFSESKQALSEACDLPLKLKTKVEPKCFAENPEFSLPREDEKNIVYKSLENYLFAVKNGKVGGLTPCLCSDSGYVLNLYAEFIGKLFVGANIERIEIADLIAADTQSTQNDLFLRSINEEKQNVILLNFKGDTDEPAVEWAKKIIRNDFRSKYRLNSPAVSLNLSSVIVVCLSDAENAKKISGFTETIKLAKIRESEKPLVVKNIAEKTGRAYGFDTVTIDKDALKDLCAMNAEKTEKILEKVIREICAGKKEANISHDGINGFLKQKSFDNTYGFGGKINEDV